MTNLNKKIASAIGAAALLFNASAPAVFAGVSCTISGNGSDTSNTCDFASLSETNVSQNNDMDVDNDVHVDATTGHNDAEDNTGGDVSVKTGDVDSTVDVSTSGNTNVLSAEGTATDNDFNLEISGNGTDSDNNVEVDVTDTVSVDQSNDADVDNDIHVDGDTGGNDASDNTGGDVEVKTGDVDSSVSISTAVNANSATVGSDHNAGDLSIKVKDNGSDTDNSVDLALLSEVELDQSNDADVDNDVHVDADTGWNDANDNTGGDTSIKTGDSDVDVTVDTMANFNTADVMSALAFDDVELKVAGNGTDSDNNIELDLIDSTNVDQDNDLDVDNDHIKVEAKTGKNDAEDNTVGNNGDPVIKTGDATTTVGVSTSGNANAFGEDMNVEVSVDMHELLDLLQQLVSLLHL